MPERTHPPCAELRQLYDEERLSQAAIGLRLGCSAATVASWMRRCAIPAREGRFQARPLPRALLEELYCSRRLTLAAIAAQLGVSVSTVHNWRRAYGIPARGRRAARA